MRLQRALLGLAAIALFASTLVPWSPGTIVAASTPSPVPTYCYPVYTPVPGASGLAAPMATELSHAEVCGGQYGDVYSDGPFYTPSPTSTANSFSFTLPANVFSVFGRRTYVPDTTKTAVNNATTYCYLDSSGYPSGIWNCNTLNTPPNPYAELMYTITTDGSGVTALTTPAPAHLFVQNAHILEQTGHAGNCAYFNADGSFFASPCSGGGGGGGTAVAGNCITVTPTASPTGGQIISYSSSNPGCSPTPAPLPTSANNNCSFAGVVLTCITPTPGAAATATATACGAPVSVSGGNQVNVPVCPSPYPTPATPTPMPSVLATSTACAYNSGLATMNPSNQVVVPNCVTPNPFEAAVLARSDVTHFWEMHDNPGGCASNCTPGPCPTGAGGISDSIAGGATALPSPVPLTVVTTSPVPPPTCAMPPIYFGGGKSIGFCNNSATNGQGCNGGSAINSYLSVPITAAITAPGTFFCVINNVNVNGNGIWNQDQSTALNLLIASGGTLETVVNGTARTPGGDFSSGKAFVVVVISTPNTFLYANGVPVTAPSSTPAAPNGTTGSIGVGFVASAFANGYSGQISDCGLANTAWSLSTVQYLDSLLGL